MNKTQLIDVVATKTGLTKKAAEAAVNAVMAAIENALVEGDKVQLVGFGTFEVKTRAGRMCKIPGTNQEVTVPDSKIPTFKAGKVFKEKVR